MGTSPNPLIKSTTEGLETQKWGGIVADADTGLTSRPGVYAGGDAVSGAATVILAMGAGKTAASAIDRPADGLSFFESSEKKPGGRGPKIFFSPRHFPRESSKG